MSDTDSFIEEVSEEVRRDRLYGYARRYGWIVALVLIAIVGGTAFFEYRSSQAEQVAQTRGDAILAALQAPDDAARTQALADLNAEDTSVVTTLLAARTPDSAPALQALSVDMDQPTYIRDLARLRLAAMADALPRDERIAVLQDLSAPGGLYRTPALDLLVLTQLELGERDAALALMQDAIQDATTASAQINRFVELIVAMGETPQLATTAAPATQN